ncbi:Tex family protein [Helicovermis profundi]|uniref:Tex family protein n=1 Tax=Helicovermis profundi TaxID=3065157 RepID=A0AAU9EN83_9FIRM|nr:Tex family protein [Clostridia bacterium S502]
MKLIIKKLSEELRLRVKQVEDTINLIDEGNTIPFIARYRKEVTGGISDEVLRDFDERLKYLRNLKTRKEEVIRLIDEQGKLTEELKKKIEAASVLNKLEDLYRPYKLKKRTRATIAKEKGLENLSNIILDQENSLEEIREIAKNYISKEKEVENVENAINGALDIIAEKISDNADYREFIRNSYINKGILETKAVKLDEQSVYEMYYEYKEPLIKIANHRILAINRAEKEKFIKVKLISKDEEIIEHLSKKIIAKENCRELLTLAIEDSYKRLIAPSVEREVRNMLSERAEEDAIKVFAKNTKPLFLIPPVKDAITLAVDPSYRTGCKLAVLDKTGKLLDYKTIYPNKPQNKIEDARVTVKALINKYKVDIIPIGNGTASRETEKFIADTIKEIDRKVYYTIVSEAGASVYSASKLATEEYPDIDVSIRGAISIGRRLQDPLAELVKIDPKSIGVGQYQHDLNQKKLDQSLTNVVEDCVNSVGIDLNTATPSLLKYVSGISYAIAKNVVLYRDENGKFTSRKELKKVKRLGDKAYEQCAGFLRIFESENPLDNTAIHPESYDNALKLLNELGYTIDDVKNSNLNDIEKRITDIAPLEVKKVKKISSRGGFEALRVLKENNNSKKDEELSNIKRLENGYKLLSEKVNLGVLTLKDIVEEIRKPGRDPREDMPKPVFRSDVLTLDDLSEGMVLDGTVRNVVNFGAFVDIGIKTDGLVHVSELSNKFVSNPMAIVSVGDNVTVKIIKIDRDRGKVSLSMKM